MSRGKHGMARRALFKGPIALCLLAALALVGCGDNEAVQRKAFIAFLQTRIIDKPGVHVPKLTPEETAAFGEYAKHYAVITDFNATMDNAVAAPVQQAVATGTPRSLEDLVARREQIATVAAGLATIRGALDQALTAADAAHAALKQPGDLKPVYDQAYERDVTMPAKTMAEIFPLIDESMKAVLSLADFIAKHQDAIKLQGSTIQTSDASLQAPLTAMIDAVRADNEAIVKARQKLDALVLGH